MKEGNQIILRRDIPTIGGGIPKGRRGIVLLAFTDLFGDRMANVQFGEDQVSCLAVEDLELLSESNDASDDNPEADDAGNGRDVHGDSRANDRHPSGGGNGLRGGASPKPARQRDILAGGTGKVPAGEAGGSVSTGAKSGTRATNGRVLEVGDQLLKRCGWRIAPKAYRPGHFTAVRAELNATWDRDNQLLTLWGTNRAMTPAEVEAEFPPSDAPAIPTVAEGRKRLAASGWIVEPKPFAPEPDRFDCRKGEMRATWVPDLDRFWIRGTKHRLTLADVERDFGKVADSSEAPAPAAELPTEAERKTIRQPSLF